MINEHRERTEEVKSESQREPFTSLVVDRKISKSKKPLVIKQETRYNQDIKSKKNHMGAFYPFVSESNLTLSIQFFTFSNPDIYGIIAIQKI